MMQAAEAPPPIRPAPASAVLDTNVLLDWLVFNDARIAPMAHALIGGRLIWLSCPSMRAELARMLTHRSLAGWSPDAEKGLAAHDLRARIHDDPPRLPVHGPRCSDADDQVFVDLALSASARWLLTHDRALLRMARRLRGLGVEVLTPMAWAARHGEVP